MCVLRIEHHLYILVAEYLRAHPPTQETPLKVPVQGLPRKVVPPPAVPRGWKMGEILPLHSPGVTGGGVSENMFKDMMAEMGGEGGMGLDQGSGGKGLEGEGKKKKEKKKVKG